MRTLEQCSEELKARGVVDVKLSGPTLLKAAMDNGATLEDVKNSVREMLNAYLDGNVKERDWSDLDPRF